MWSLALLGIAIRLFWLRRLYRFTPLFYLGLGWLVLGWVVPLYETVGAGGLSLIVAGGIAYTSGLLFFRWRGLRFTGRAGMRLVRAELSPGCPLSSYIGLRLCSGKMLAAP